jgi:hypothetical protein
MGRLSLLGGQTESDCCLLLSLMSLRETIAICRIPFLLEIFTHTCRACVPLLHDDMIGSDTLPSVQTVLQSFSRYHRADYQLQIMPSATPIPPAHPILASTLHDIHTRTLSRPPGKRRKLATGFKALDREVLVGGFDYGEGGLVCFSASEDGGKSKAGGGGANNGSMGEEVGGACEMCCCCHFEDA